jgi:hypothetical protein
MLPQFQRFTQEAGSLDSNSSFTFLNSPRYSEDLLPSVETDHTLAEEAKPSAARVSSPSPLMHVSVPLPPAAETRGALSTGDVAGLVRSPASGMSAPTARPSCAGSFVERSTLSQRRNFTSPDTDVMGGDGGTRCWMELPSDAASSEGGNHDDEDSRSNDSTRFESTAFINMSSNDFSVSASPSSSSSPQVAEWGVVWMHIFPQHIAGFLTVRDVVELGLVCRTAQAAVQQPWVWRSLAVCHYGVHAASVERVLCFSAQQWARDGVSCKDGACDHRPTALLLMCDQHQQLQYQRLESDDAEVPAVTISTATTPWLMRETTLTLASEDGVEADEYSSEGEGEEEETETAEYDGASDEDFNSTQLPQITGEDGNDAVVGARTVHESEGGGGVPASAPVSAPAPASAVAAHVSTRAALASGSRYLWQTAAAAMPSPSSPIASPTPEGEDSDDDAQSPGGLGPVPNSVAPTPYPLLATAAPSFCAAAPPPPPSTPFPACAVVAPCAGELPTSAVEVLNSNSSSKCATALFRTAVRCEQLPPPSPAQLDGSVGGEELQHTGEEEGKDSDDGASAAAAMTTTTQSDLFSSPTTRRHPSHVLEQTIDTAFGTGVDGAALAVPLPAAAAAMCDSPDAAAATTLPSLSPSPASVPMHCYTLCRATAERSVLKATPDFPWLLFTRYLYANRVQTSLSRFLVLSRRAREELCRGSWEAAYGSLSHIIHAFFQQNSCRGVEHLRHLAQALVRRASLCRHRGHLHLVAAFTDLCTAALLCPDSVATSEVAELRARDEFSAVSPETWMHLYEDAAQVASPVALLGTVAQIPFLFPQRRALCFCSVVVAYMRAYRVFGQSLTHLLCRASEWAAPGTEEELLVRALRETEQAKQCPQRSSAHYVRKACATADYALSLTPLDRRRAVDVLTHAWVRDCFTSEGAVYSGAMTQWAAKSPDARRFTRTTTLESRWLAWLTCEVRTFVFTQLTDKLPAKTPLASVVLACTSYDRAESLVRIAAQYASYDMRTEDLYPPLPRHGNRRRIAQYLLHNALRLRPLHTTAALLLSRVYAAAEAEAEEETGLTADGVSMSSAVLTDCIHRWARRFSLLELPCNPTGRRCATLTPYLHRRERCPDVCFIPSELLVGRNRCLHTVADLAEATEQHPSLSYPYQMRAAMAMDRGYHLAAIAEMGRIMKLSLDVNDVALRARFLQDALDAPSPRFTEEVSTTPSPRLPPSFRSASFESVPRTPDTSSSSPHSPSLESSLQSRTNHRVWLARLSGLVTLLRPPESFQRDGEQEDAGSLGCSQSSSRFFSRELPSMTTRDYGSGHVSRVASMAFSEAEGDSALRSGSGGGDGVDAAHVRAFLEELVSSAGTLPAIAS